MQPSKRIPTMQTDYYRIVNANGEEQDFVTARDAIKAAQQLADDTGMLVDVYEHYMDESMKLIMTVRPKPLTT